MIEKYGADPDMIPYTDDQYATLNKLASDNGVEVPFVQTFGDAEEAIAKLKNQEGAE